ncbi:MAG: pilin [Actinobacteria bacterium]|nr:pilin [Actinomycetota bacterium]
MKLFTIFSQISGFFDDIDHPNKDGSLGSDQIASVTEFVFIAAGIISVVMIIVGGYWYTLSGGDPQKVSRAKKTILWSVIGLAMSISAWAIVGFVLGQAE